jgi:P-type Mg2+ transporter
MKEKQKLNPAYTVLKAAHEETNAVLKEFGVTLDGLHNDEAHNRLIKYGKNEVAAEKKKRWFSRLIANFTDPLSILLAALGVISYLTGDLRTTTLIFIMLLMSVFLRFFQEMKADAAAEKLKAMVHTTATVIRGGIQKDVPLKTLVPGDIIHLSAGDMVPADIRLITSRDFFINQAALTGESVPVEKHAPPVSAEFKNELEFQNICFMGTNAESGSAVAIAIATGRSTRLGALADTLIHPRVLTGFDKGVSKFTWLMISFILIMTPFVFLINGLTKGNWLEAFLFAVAVAVGLAPELLPMIVTVNLSKGAYDMSKKKVIVKRLNSIQNFGAMDILCTDKTGTLTEGRVVLIKHLDIEGKENEKIMDFAYINSFYQTGLKNLMDIAILKHDTAETKNLSKTYKKADEIPFDFIRRRMSVVVEDPAGDHLLICKGAVEEVVAHCKSVVVGGKTISLEKYHHKSKEDLIKELSSDGFRLVALAYKHMSPGKTVYKAEDEAGMTLFGFLAFLDPPKPTAGKAIHELMAHGISVKILTGDNELVTRKICGELGIEIKSILLGSEVESMSDDALSRAAEKANVFYKLEPADKERVIRVLQKAGHVVGFLGDGINDAPALKASDVGISVDGAVDIAKESADIILLEKSLMILKEGVREGRRVFANIVKYIRMGASSNFGNMFSVLGASIFLPFLPMLPLQIITNNILYDMSQITIPTDGTDEEYLKKPRQWDIGNIKRYILYIGPISSLYDYATYFIMIFVFNCWANPSLFQTGWFVESLLSQTLIIHVIRTNKIPFIQSRASWPLMLSTFLVVAIGIFLPFSPIAKIFGFVPLPLSYFAIIGGMLITYFILTQYIKKWLAMKYNWE